MCEHCGAPVVVVQTARGPWRICVNMDCPGKEKKPARGRGARGAAKGGSAKGGTRKSAAKPGAKKTAAKKTTK